MAITLTTNSGGTFSKFHEFYTTNLQKTRDMYIVKYNGTVSEKKQTSSLNIGIYCKGFSRQTLSPQVGVRPCVAVSQQ